MKKKKQCYVVLACALTQHLFIKNYARCTNAKQKGGKRKKNK